MTRPSLITCRKATSRTTLYPTVQLSVRSGCWIRRRLVCAHCDIFFRRRALFEHTLLINNLDLMLDWGVKIGFICLVQSSIDWLIDSSVCSNDWLIDCSLDWLIFSSYARLIDWLINVLLSQVIDLIMVWLIVWLIDLFLKLIFPSFFHPIFRSMSKLGRLSRPGGILSRSDVITRQQSNRKTHFLLRRTNSRRQCRR